MRFLFILLMVWANSAYGHTYPDYQSTTVNDFADLLDPSDEVELSNQLDQLKQDTGVEMTILTLGTQDDYARNLTLEEFATGLFNEWGIGDAVRNDGVLVMVIRDDRAMRIELGEAYGRDWDATTWHIVNHHFLPAFKASQFASGIKTGTTAIIDDVIHPFRAGQVAPKEEKNDGSVLWLIGAFVVLTALMRGRNLISDLLARFRTCPKCGNRSLRQSRSVTVTASTVSAGSGIIRLECLNCDYCEETNYHIPRISVRSSSGSGGGFGGGRSGGGGASGRW